MDNPYEYRKYHPTTIKVNWSKQATWIGINDVRPEEIYTSPELT